MYATTVTFRLTSQAAAPSIEGLTSAMQQVEMTAARIEHITIMRRPNEIIAVIFVTADDVATALAATSLAAAAGERSSVALHTLSVRLHQPE